jgi:drug/metabolite transporter (DMT)-like permease
MASPSAPSHARLPALVAGFATLYLVWGSTYLGIKFAVETLPPFLMAGLRFIIAGSVLYLWLRLSGAPRPTLVQWRSAVLGGALLLLGGNGLVTWGQQRGILSGIAALIVGTTPIWMVMLSWLFDGGRRPGIAIVLGMTLGFFGVVLLIHPTGWGDAERDTLPLLAILAAPVCWVLGSLYSRRVPGGSSPLLSSALQMLAGGGLMVAAGSLLGEWSVLADRTISARSALAFAYLTLVGSLVAFSTYTWLLRVASPAAVSTYAYVNPLVAVFLGWLLGNESLEAETLLAAGLIVGAVLLITWRRSSTSAPKPKPARLSDGFQRLAPDSGAAHWRKTSGELGREVPARS